MQFEVLSIVGFREHADKFLGTINASLVSAFDGEVSDN